jgi:hypothetical protein
MATGKTNARWIRVLVDDSGGTARDISAAVNNVSEVGLTFDETEVTGFSDGVKNFTLGHPSAEIEISGPFSNLADTGAHTVFNSIDGVETATKTVTIQIGIRAAPAGGDPEFEGEYVCSKYTVNPGDGTYTARMVPGSGTAPAWGTV